MKIAFIEWVDSSEFKRRKADDDMAIDPILNGGLVVKEDDEYIHLAFYFNHTADTYEPVLGIPKVCIKTIKTFEV